LESNGDRFNGLTQISNTDLNAKVFSFSKILMTKEGTIWFSPKKHKKKNSKKRNESQKTQGPKISKGRRVWGV